MKENIVLAVEPNEIRAARVQAMVKAAKAWSKSAAPPIKAVSYVSPKDLNWTPSPYPMLQVSGPEIRSGKIFPAVKKVSPELLDQLEICTGKSASRNEEVARFLEVTQKIKPQLIIAGTHGRRGLKRFRLGSFAETLGSVSKTPVMVINDQVKIPVNFKKIFFAADFSKECMKAFRFVLSLAQKHGAEVIIFHGFEPYSDIYFAASGMGPDAIFVAKALEISEANQKREGRRMLRAAKSRGIKSRFIMPGYISRVGLEILRFAKEAQADLLVLPVRRGPLAQNIFGKDVRDVLCESKMPVLLLHS